MSVYIYKKHPDHNLGGENYPHFRNKADKWNYVKKELVDTQKPIKLHITRVSFDTARLTLNVKKFLIGAHPTQIAGLMTDSAQYLNLEFWFVVGWSFGSNENVVILELQLDYWLTYWPLKFNKALVRINRKHMNRFTTESSLDKLEVNFHSENRQLQIPEKTSPPAIYTVYTSFIVFRLVPHFNNLVLMKGIVVSPVGGEIDYYSANNYFVTLGSNNPGEQNGFLIFGKNSNPNLNTWLSFPGVTHVFYFFMSADDIHLCNYDVFSFTLSTDYDYVCQYSVEISSDKTADVKKKLNVVSIDQTDITKQGINYYQLGKLITRFIGLTYYINTKGLHARLKVLEVKPNFTVNWKIDNKIKNIFLAQLVSLKSFYRNLKANPGEKGEKKAGWYAWYLKDQTIRQYGGVYFTTLNAFNYYMKYRPKYYRTSYFNINSTWAEFFGKKYITKKELYSSRRKLKMHTHSKYFITFQNETHEINPVLNQRPYVPYWFVSLQKSYFILEPLFGRFKPFNKKYNMVCANKSQFINYTDNSLEFYQKQGFQFETGINQAKYQLDWTKRYNQFSVNKFYYDSTIGTLSNMFNRTTAMGGFAGKFGNTQMMAGLAVGAGLGLAESIGNTYFGYKNLQLQNEMKEKQAYYNLKMLQSKQQDIFNNPVSTNNVTDTELSYNLISNKILPKLFTLEPTPADYEAQANLYHKYGNLNDQAEIVDLNNEWNRRCWNFWEIHNIEQAIVKDNLNHKVITFFNTLFNQGVRLWNVFNEEVVFNDYSLENWESKLLEDEK